MEDASGCPLIYQVKDKSFDTLFSKKKEVLQMKSTGRPYKFLVSVTSLTLPVVKTTYQIYARLVKFHSFYVDHQEVLLSLFLPRVTVG